MEKQTKSNYSSSRNWQAYRDERDEDWQPVREPVDDEYGDISEWRSEWNEATGQDVSMEQAREMIHNLATFFRVLDDIDRHRKAGHSAPGVPAEVEYGVSMLVPASEGGSYGSN